MHAHTAGSPSTPSIASSIAPSTSPATPIAPHWHAIELAQHTCEGLERIVGTGHFSIDPAVRIAHSHDRMPWSNFRSRTGDLTGTLASAVVRPGNATELTAIVRFANLHGVRLIPFGAGSGVVGGITPLACEVMVDLRRMDQILSIDETDCVVTVQAGMNGGNFESALNQRGFTCGHLPQSIDMSTVGGWAACRGAGQASSRYGKIEDIVLGLSAVLPNGQPLTVLPVARRSAGPSIKDLLIGSEGVFGFITELNLRIWPKPEYESATVWAFPSRQAGFDALRSIMQSELRPQVARLYDETESRHRAAQLPELIDRPVLCILKFGGIPQLAQMEELLAVKICTRHGAVRTDDRPWREWEASRYVSYSAEWQEKGYYMDSIEVAANWSRIPAMYERMKAAVARIDPAIHFAAHWSHVYPEGACQYMTIRIPPMPQDEAMSLHQRAWDAALNICIESRGSIAHHHGVGIFRNRWLATELNTGLELLQAVKDHIDPLNLLNAGKAGMRPAPDAVTPFEGFRP
jgi:alkyldihydroxyacetonephosphate synthase